MKNFKINQVNSEIKNGWTVRADTKRFGENQIMFEGSYEECWEYIERMAYTDRDHVTVIVSGKRNGIEAQRLTVRKYNDGFTHYPQFEFPNFILPTDIEKLNQFIA